MDIPGFGSRAMFQYFVYRERLVKLKAVFCGKETGSSQRLTTPGEGKEGSRGTTCGFAKSWELPASLFFYSTTLRVGAHDMGSMMSLGFQVDNQDVLILLLMK